MKKFMEPEILVMNIDVNDVITASGGNGNVGSDSEEELG